MKVDNQDRVSIPTKIMATFDVEHTIFSAKFQTLQYCDEWRKFTSVSESVSESVGESVSQS